MNSRSGADRPGPAPSGPMKWARGTPKSEEWCGKPARLHGPLLLGCGQGLAPHRFIGKRRAVSSIQAKRVHGPKTCQPWPRSSCTRFNRQTAQISGGAPSPPGRAVQCCGQDRLSDPAYFACAHTGRSPCHYHKDGHRCERSGASPYEGPLSAKASQDLGRSGSRRRPRRLPKRWRASAHIGRCRAARS